MRSLLIWIVTAMMTALPAAAGDRPVVVELYTSQGCSSCPPADALLHDLAARDDVIALAMHVDYWDYIGWKDSFASPAFTERQRSYARAGGRRMVYTPQMIINGADHVVGNRPRDVSDLIRRHGRAAGQIILTARKTGRGVSISADAAARVQGPLVVQLIRYRPRSKVAIKRGENAGRTLSYANVVTEMTVLQTWDTRQPLTIEAPMPGDLPAVVLVQRQGPGTVEAAARVE